MLIVDPPIRYGLIVFSTYSATVVILRHVAFEKSSLFHVVVNNMAVGFRYAFGLVSKIVYCLGFVVENYCCKMLDYF